MTCTTCGQPLAASDAFCGKCGAAAPASAGGIILERGPAHDARTGADPMAESAGFADAGASGTSGASGASGASAAPATVMPVMTAPPGVAPSAGSPPRFRLALDEVLLKTYEVVQLRPGLLKRKRGQGTLYVTDARVVFYAWVYPRGTQRESWMLQQTKLEDISGLEAYVSRRISLGLLVLTIFFGLAAISTIITRGPAALIVVFVLLAVLFGFLLAWDASRRGSVGVTINSRENDNSPIKFGGRGRMGLADMFVRFVMAPILIFFPSYNAYHVAAGDPAEDADRLLHELGALILDLQTRGTVAYAHWGIADGTGNGRVPGVQ